MKRPKSHEVDESAQRIFQGLIPERWIHNKQGNDYGKDYVVEIVDNDGSVTGETFYVQLKGRTTVRLSRDGRAALFSLDRKHSEYYLDRVTDNPVFLVLVDTTRRQAWWGFLQGLLDKSNEWRKHKKSTLPLALNDNLGDFPRFLDAIKDARQFLQRLNAGSIDDAIFAERRRIAKVDPRFDATLSVVAGRPCFDLHALSPVDVKLKIAGARDSIGPKLESLGKGDLVRFAAGELAIEGSPLFREVHQQGAALQFSFSIPGELALACWDAAGRDLSPVVELPGAFCGGMVEQRFEATVSNSPFQFALGPLKKGVSGALQIHANFRKWDGQRLLELAHFAKMHDFFTAVPNSSRVSIKCHKEGNEVLRVSLPLHQDAIAKPMAQYLSLVHKAREVARRSEINPVWSHAAFDDDAQETADQVHGILFNDVWRKPAPNARISANILRSTLNPKAWETASRRDHLRVVEEAERKHVLLGEEISIGRIAVEFTEMVMARDSHQRITPTRRRQTRRSGKEPSIPIVFEGTPSTIMTMRPASTVNDAAHTRVGQAQEIDC